MVPGRLQALFDDFQVDTAFDAFSGCIIENDAALDAPLARAKTQREVRARVNFRVRIAACLSDTDASAGAARRCACCMNSRAPCGNAAAYLAWIIGTIASVNQHTVSTTTQFRLGNEVEGIGVDLSAGSSEIPCRAEFVTTQHTY